MVQGLEAHNTRGNHSGNTGNNNTHSSFNNINKIVLPGVTHFEVPHQGSALGVGEAAPGPHRFIPYCRNDRFAGRKCLLEEVKRFSEGKGHNRVALHGLGGSGKTQIALEYVHQRASESNWNIFWVQGSEVSKFSEGFRDIAQHVRIPLASAKKDENGFLLSVRRWFEGPNSGSWILVIDNADNEDDFVSNDSPIAKFIPQGISGTLIFTTRSRLVASRQGCRMIEVGKMGEEEALELFSNRFDSWGSLKDEEKKHVVAILGLVYHLPLAIVGSAVFMTETETPPSTYRTIFQENETRMKDLLSQPFCDIQREAAESILSTYFSTFAQIRQQMPLAADLLRLIAFFNHQNIPEELLTQCGLEGMDHSANFRYAIGKLLGFSLVTIVKCGDRTFYDLDRLVQLSLQAYLPTEELDQGRAAALEVISQFFPQSQDGRRDIDPAYIPHAVAVTRDSKDPIAEELGFRVALYLLDMGSYDNADIQIRECAALRAERKE
ncbi:P-loop containing nucleoside triphosphate hydrolase protein [Tuber borchii]|uniref:P-loop containing nucleoside triphosphate hydrolase protein n=1 Tax=Tuber borchii TaxID=42251 RepID=A0A2T6ZH92_TUBBO|nr:P-loop containing nucleoside triphosphate hydrolase protein [Tuber borchii]